MRIGTNLEATANSGQLRNNLMDCARSGPRGRWHRLLSDAGNFGWPPNALGEDTPVPSSGDGVHEGGLV